MPDLPVRLSEHTPDAQDLVGKSVTYKGEVVGKVLAVEDGGMATVKFHEKSGFYNFTRLRMDQNWSIVE